MLDVSQDSVDGKSTVAPTAIGTDIDQTNISVLASKGLDKDAVDAVGADKKDKDDALADASSIGKGAPTVDTSVAGGRGDDSLLDANLSNADYVHPTIRRTEVVLKEKQDKQDADK